MSEQLRESVSALIDGEADDLEIRRLLTDDNAEQVRATWSSYQSLRETLHGGDEHQRFADLDVSQRISAAIASEPSPALSLQRAQPSSWLKAVSGFAVAASVTVAVVIGVQGVQPTSEIYNDLAATAVGPAERRVVQPSSLVSSRVYATFDAASTVSYGNSGRLSSGQSSFPSMGARATSQVVADLEAQKRLERYMLRHTERAALNNGQGMISYARIVSSESP